MCGIIGILSRKYEAAPRLIDGLKRLEYRGYDSTGLATLHQGSIHRRRAEGKIRALEALIQKEPLLGATGIGHTRWATHGAPVERNAHPHSNEHVAVVHNGIIENHHALRSELEANGYIFSSDTDTEVLVHLATYFLEQGIQPLHLMPLMLEKIQGAYAFVLIFSNFPDLILGTRKGCPLAIGIGQGDNEGELYLGSDALALLPLTNKISYLEEGDWVILTANGTEIFNFKNERVERPVQHSTLNLAAISKQNHKHFMLKEIYEQPIVVAETLKHYIDSASHQVSLPEFPFDWKSVPKVTVVGCGTAYYAGFIAKYWFEEYARLPVEIEIASEFRYRKPPLPEGGVAIFVSQSGETADTLAALSYAKEQGQYCVGVINARESSMERESHVVLPTLAGPEIGVASTKAFTTQLATLLCVVLDAALKRGIITPTEQKAYAEAAMHLPSLIADSMSLEPQIEILAASLAKARDVLYLGRGASYPLALEGALKLKEISYIHAEGYAAGEMKHGPIALIDESVPVVVIAPKDGVFDKTASNVHEVLARGGQIIMLSTSSGLEALKLPAETLLLPETKYKLLDPILYSIPLQLLAYHTALLKGHDIDQPRNLAKSVTVE